jgi:MFS family permease
MRFRFYSLLAISFCTGMAVMAFEILGSRLLAPAFGSSVFVWGALIGVVMAGLSTGYFAGGWLSDLKSSFAILGALLLSAGFMILLVPWYGHSILEFVSRLTSGPRLGPLLACLSLFLLPSMFMGAVSPYSVRLLVRDMARLGRSVGLLYGFSTLGSILGTMGTAFYLILWMGTRASFFLLGSLTLALSALAFVQCFAGRRKRLPS